MSGVKIVNKVEPIKSVFLKNLSYGTVFMHNGNPHMKIYVSGKEGMAVNLTNGIAISLNFGNFALREVVELTCTMEEVDPNQYLIKRGLGEGCPPEEAEEDGVHFLVRGSFTPKTVEEEEEEEEMWQKKPPKIKKTRKPDISATLDKPYQMSDEDEE